MIQEKLEIQDGGRLTEVAESEIGDNFTLVFTQVLQLIV